MSSSESGFDRYGCTAADELGEWPDNAVAKACRRGHCAGYQILPQKLVTRLGERPLNGHASREQ